MACLGGQNPERHGTHSESHSKLGQSQDPVAEPSISISEFLSFITCPSRAPFPMISPPAILFPAGTQRHRGTPRTSWTKGRKGRCSARRGEAPAPSPLGLAGARLPHCGQGSPGGSCEAHPTPTMAVPGRQQPLCPRSAQMLGVVPVQAEDQRQTQFLTFCGFRSSREMNTSCNV